ncbi:MAG: hypothetical protein V3V28_09335 [Polaribacter sp.]|uniref:hypothetical protein n=1 Tax=Polaribacter sp. TaxID=1920175 RepID=UPI002F35765C
MSNLNLNTTEEEFEGAYDAAIKHYVHGKEGGAVLDMTGFSDAYVYKGHGIINDNGTFKPQPVDGSQYAKLVGVVRSNTKASKPSTGIMTQGTINNNAVKYPFNANSLAALQALGIYNQVD